MILEHATQLATELAGADAAETVGAADAAALAAIGATAGGSTASSCR